MEYVGYYRVSTKKQSRSGLGLEAQQQMVRQFAETNGSLVLADANSKSAMAFAKHIERSFASWMAEDVVFRDCAAFERDRRQKPYR